MSTTTYVVHGDALDPWIAERRRLGLDTRDEVWNGEVWRIAPAAESVEVVTAGGAVSGSDVLGLSTVQIAEVLGWS